MAATKPKVFLQLDTDAFASSFDSIVGIDAGADHVLPYPGVKPQDVESIVHGAMFTRSPQSLASTMIFVGGSDSVDADLVYRSVLKTLFPPFHVSVMLDPSGCNTTSAAAVWAAFQNVKIRNSDGSSGDAASREAECGATDKPGAVVQVDQASDLRALVLGATGAVGRSVVKLLAATGVRVVASSRSPEKSKGIAEQVNQELSPSISVESTDNDHWFEEAKRGPFHLVFACGAAGKNFASQQQLEKLSECPSVLIDLNAVPPSGIEGVQATDCQKVIGQSVCYGAVGVGNYKMKLHKEAIRRCFRSNKLTLDLFPLYQLAQEFLD